MPSSSRLTRWSISNWLLVIEAWWDLLLAAVLIRLPWGRRELLQQALTTGVGPASRAGLAVAPATSLGLPPVTQLLVINAIGRAGRFHLRTMKCLEQSLALVWMLRRHGLAAWLQIGCRRDGSELGFHAWVIGQDCIPVDINESISAFAPLSFASSMSGISA